LDANFFAVFGGTDSNAPAMPIKLERRSAKVQRTVIYVVQRPQTISQASGATYSGHDKHVHTNLYPCHFAVESRQNFIVPEHNDELQKYITGIITEQRTN
jgi:hypothetical protein